MASEAPEKALYVGEAGNALTDGTPLVPGETIALVPRGEAEASDLWQPVDKGKPASSKPRNSKPDKGAVNASNPPPSSELPDVELKPGEGA